MLPRFDTSDAQRAFDEWGANCGPGAIAAMTGMTLDDVRPLLGDFETKRYTNPTLMFETLERIGKPWRKIGAEWPVYGLARIQWEGPWTAEGVPMRVRYGYTHWVGSWKTEARGHGVFDINCINNGSGWVTFKDWDDFVVPALVHKYKKSTGGWHVTHGIELEKSARAQ